MGLSNYVPSSRISQAGVCTSTTRPATPYEGQVVYETDTDLAYIYDGSAWRYAGFPPHMTVLRATSISQAVANATEVSILFGAGTELVDTKDWHSTTTNTDRITPTVAGFYQVNGNISFNTNTGSARYFAGIYKNNTQWHSTSFYGTNFPTGAISTVVEMNGTTDYLTLVAYHQQGVTVNVSNAFLSCQLLRNS